MSIEFQKSSTAVAKDKGKDRFNSDILVRYNLLKQQIPKTTTSEIGNVETQLLMNLGLAHPKNFHSCKTKIEKLRMRDLDRLKMWLTKMMQSKTIPTSVRNGIRNNDLDAFAEAILTVTKTRRRTKRTSKESTF